MITKSGCLVKKAQPPFSDLIALIFAANAKAPARSREASRARRLFWRGCCKATLTGGLRPHTAKKNIVNRPFSYAHSTDGTSAPRTALGALGSPTRSARGKAEKELNCPLTGSFGTFQAERQPCLCIHRWVALHGNIIDPSNSTQIGAQAVLVPRNCPRGTNLFVCLLRRVSVANGRQYSFGRKF